MMWFEKARELGTILSNTDEYISYKEAESAFLENEQVAILRDELEQKKIALKNSMSQGSIDETLVADAREALDGVLGRMNANEIIRIYFGKKAEFKKLYDHVNAVLLSCLGENENFGSGSSGGSSGSGCSSMGSSGCGGCGCGGKKGG